MAGDELIPGLGDGTAAVLDDPTPPEIEIDPEAGTPPADGAAPEPKEDDKPGEGGDEGKPEEEGGADDKEKPLDPDLSAVKDPKELDAKTRELIADLKKTRPNAAKLLADAFFGRKAFEKEFPTVQAARQARATLEAVGGEEGIETLNTSLQEWEAEGEQFANADPALVGALYESNPEAVVENAINILELLNAKNQDHLDAAMLPTFAKRLDASGLGQSLVFLEALIKEGKGQEAYNLLANVAKWYQRLQENAKKVGEGRTKRDPEREAFENEKREFASTKEKEYIGTCRSEADKLNYRSMNGVAGTFMKDMKFDAEGKREFLNLLNTHVLRAMGEDKSYLRTVRGIRDKKDVQKTAEYVNAKFAELLPEVFRRLRNKMYPNAAPMPKPGTPAKPAANGNGKPNVAAPKVVAGKTYERKDVDIDNTPDVYLITGKAYLKGTKNLVPYNRG